MISTSLRKSFVFTHSMKQVLQFCYFFEKLVAVEGEMYGKKIQTTGRRCIE